MTKVKFVELPIWNAMRLNSEEDLAKYLSTGWQLSQIVMKTQHIMMAILTYDSPPDAEKEEV